MSGLKAPFPYFGGKARAAPLVWERFGDVRNYVEPFFGSGAVLLQRPLPFDGPETVNDADGLLCNAWRAITAAPDEVAAWADFPASECDLTARHAWLVGQRDSLQVRLEADPDWCDPKAAGWWVWGISLWIGAGWCSGNGCWAPAEVDGVRQLVHLGDPGQGVHRQLVHLGDPGQGVHRKRVHLGNPGQGVHRKRVHLGNPGQGIESLFAALAARLRRVRICCGDWTRVVGPTPLLLRSDSYTPTGVFLDPPYGAAAGRTDGLYSTDSLDVASAVRAWAIAHGDDRRLRIALCGFKGEHELPADWTEVAVRTPGGYGSQARTGYANRGRERIWFSPYCLSTRQAPLPLEVTSRT